MPTWNSRRRPKLPHLVSIDPIHPQLSLPLNSSIDLSISRLPSLHDSIHSVANCNTIHPTYYPHVAFVSTSFLVVSSKLCWTPQLIFCANTQASPRLITNSFYSFFSMIHNCFASTVRLSLASFFLGRMAQSRIIMTWSHPLLRFRSCQNVTPYHRMYSPDWLPALYRL